METTWTIWLTMTQVRDVHKRRGGGGYSQKIILDTRGWEKKGGQIPIKCLIKMFDFLNFPKTFSCKSIIMGKKCSRNQFQDIKHKHSRTKKSTKIKAPFGIPTNSSCTFGILNGPNLEQCSRQQSRPSSGHFFSINIQRVTWQGCTIDEGKGAKGPE